MAYGAFDGGAVEIDQKIRGLTTYHDRTTRYHDGMIAHGLFVRA